MKRTPDDFLPNEYIEHRQDRRMHLAAAALFIIVVAGLAVAFMVQRSSWNEVQAIRDDVAIRYTDAAEQVQTIVELQSHMMSVAGRSILAAALIDRLPRSVVLAEFINRMPDGLGLMEFELTTVEVELPKKDTKAAKNKPVRCNTVAQAEQEPPEPVQWNTNVSLLGFAPTDVHVSAFLASLNTHPLLKTVTLISSEEVILNDMPVRQFSILATIGHGADMSMLNSRQATANEVPQ